ncbi:MAG: hypothetical protein QOF42_838 [Gammaproteobacteria bacterium]|jgi:hypothetical protein|nr:hypothetical protein [Gammaproteobacteria bacterium]
MKAQGATRALFPVYAGLAVAALTFGLHVAWAQNDVAKITGNARVDMLLSRLYTKCIWRPLRPPLRPELPR